LQQGCGRQPSRGADIGSRPLEYPHIVLVAHLDYWSAGRDSDDGVNCWKNTAAHIARMWRELAGLITLFDLCSSEDFPEGEIAGFF
jgi:hypothetical protein